MSTFVLVHGSSGGGWVWKKLEPLLRAAGHEVYAPTLTGLSDRSHLVDCGVDLSTHITDISNFIFYWDLADVILVGNSYGGMVITGVAATMPERLKMLVYLDAYVPEDGQSEVDLWPPERKAHTEQTEEEGLAQPPSLAMFGVTDPALLKWCDERTTPHPVSTYREPVSSPNAESETLPRAFIHCVGNPAGSPDVFGPFAMQAREQGWDVYEIAAGHVAMLTAPRELSTILLGIANNAS